MCYVPTKFKFIHAKQKIAITGLAGLACNSSHSHSFVQSYSLPVPFSFYAGGAALALVLSFIVAAIFVKVSKTPESNLTKNGQVEATSPVQGSAVSWTQTLSLMLLLLCIFSGFIGSSDSFQNINMTIFWIVLFLAVPYTVFLFGDFYKFVNPWTALIGKIEQITRIRFTGRSQYPAWLGYFPGLILYVALIAIELFGRFQPFGMSMALASYTMIIVFGAWFYGKDVWLSRSEVFGIMCELLGRISVRSMAGSGLQRPVKGALGKQPLDMGLILFVLFMLSSTAFDGFHSTVQWLRIYWEGVYPQIREIDTWWKSIGGNHYSASTFLYGAWHWFGLIASPFLYLAIFTLFIHFCGVAGRSNLGTRILIGRFAFSLLPIAFVYHLSHYFTLVLMQGPKLIQLMSDPFGIEWDLFGTANWQIEPIMLDVSILWHIQVAMIIAGHVASVVYSHYEALRTFSSPRLATLSQLPMLILMVLFTASGLWILSLPISPTT